MMNAREEAPVRLTHFSHDGGCGCKIAPAVLEQILAKSGSSLLRPELLVGTETSDDAAVYQINDSQAIVATTDFFMPIVDDPFDFGAIAATNAISDVYARERSPRIHSRIMTLSSAREIGWRQSNAMTLRRSRTVSVILRAVLSSVLAGYCASSSGGAAF